MDRSYGQDQLVKWDVRIQLIAQVMDLTILAVA